MRRAHVVDRLRRGLYRVSPAACEVLGVECPAPELLPIAKTEHGVPIPDEGSRLYEALHAAAQVEGVMSARHIKAALKCTTTQAQGALSALARTYPHLVERPQKGRYQATDAARRICGVTVTSSEVTATDVDDERQRVAKATLAAARGLSAQATEAKRQKVKKISAAPLPEGASEADMIAAFIRERGVTRIEGSTLGAHLETMTVTVRRRRHEVAVHRFTRYGEHGMTAVIDGVPTGEWWPGIAEAMAGAQRILEGKRRAT